MDLSLYAAFIGAVVALALLPGPNMALIVANSVAWGPRYGLLTLVGTSTALMVQLAVTGLGLTELLRSAGSAFEVLRWVGVGYLLLLGILQWRAAVTDLTQVRAEPRSPRAIVARAALVSLTNPKTLLFFAAFFPQFISTEHPAGPQVALLSLTFLVVIVMVDSCFALLAGRARGLLARHGRLRNRISGGLLVGPDWGWQRCGGSRAALLFSLSLRERAGVRGSWLRCGGRGAPKDGGPVMRKHGACPPPHPDPLPEGEGVGRP